jgi:quercetin dioxygenase-like cupin family protein
MSAPRIGARDELPPESPFPGIERRVLDTEVATVTWYEFEPGATFPLHRHPQQQVTLVEEGSVEMTIADGVERLSAGGWSVVPGGVEHGITAGESGARIVAVVVPPRAGADAYEVLR